MTVETSAMTVETSATTNEAIERRNVVQSKSDGGVAWVIWHLPLVCAIIENRKAVLKTNREEPSSLLVPVESWTTRHYAFCSPRSGCGMGRGRVGGDRPKTIAERNVSNQLRRHHVCTRSSQHLARDGFNRF